MRSFRSRFKSSFLRDTYWAISHRERLATLQKEVLFYQSVLIGFKRGDLVFDIGANVGAKTDIFLRLGARVVAVEPDNECSKSLEGRFLEWRIRSRPVTVVAKAVSNEAGTDEMFIDGPGSAVNTMSSKWVASLRKNKDVFEHRHCGLEFKRTRIIETTTIEDLIVEHGVPFFVKIDVEGHELSALRGLRRPVSYLSFEVNLPEFRVEGLQSVALLSKLAPSGRFNYVTDCTRGLALANWLAPTEFARELERCRERSIEVFWKTKLH